MLINVNGVLRSNVIGGKSPGAHVRKVQAFHDARKLKKITEGVSPLTICIIRSLGGIGDVLMSTPILRALKHQFPNSDITYATDFKYMGGALKELLQYNPYINKLVPYQTVLGQEFDFITDITAVAVGIENSNPRGCGNRIDLFAEHVGLDLAPTGYLPEYIISNDEKIWAKEKLGRYPLKSTNCKRIGIQVRSSTQSRSWPLEKVRELAIMLAKHDYIQVFLFDSSFGNGPDEQWNIPGLVAFKDYGIRQVAALINEMDLMICPDSGLLHIAGALNKRIVSIWAGTNYKARINHYPNAIAIASEHLKCYPCFYSASACQKRYWCLDNILVEQVHDTVIRHLKTEVKQTTIKCSETKDTSIVGIRRNTGGWGDVINTTGAIHSLRKRYPESKVIVIAPSMYHDVFINNPSINMCIDIADADIYSKYLIYDLSTIDSKLEVQQLKLCNKVIHSRSEMYIQAVDGKLEEGSLPYLYVTEQEKEFIKQRFFSDTSKKYILVAISAAEEYRTWPFRELIKLTEKIKELHPNWILVFTATNRIEDKLPSNVLDLSGFGFRKLMAAVHESDAVLTPDTSVLHIAGAFHKPTVALMGPIDPELRCKGHTNTTIVTARFDCIPCWRNAEIKCKKNQKNYSDCMENIPTIFILKALEEKLQ